MKKILLFLTLFLSVSSVAQIESVDPNAGNLGQTLSVTITGSGGVNFYSISAPENISFYNATGEELFVDQVTSASDDYVDAQITIPDYVSTGPYNLLFTDPLNGQQYSLTNAFTVTNNYNTITGNVLVDVNSNGCDASDLNIAGIKVSMSNGSNTVYTFTDDAGNYEFRVGVGSFTISVLPELPSYTASPVSSVVNFGSEGGFNESRNFCLTTTTPVNDLEVVVIPLGWARPGFDAYYMIHYKNNGNQILNGTLNFTYDDTRLDLVTVDPAPASQTSGNLNFNYTDLYPFSSRYIYLVLNVNSPMETPPVNNGDLLSCSASGLPIAGDPTPANNNYTLGQTVVGSYDPNDKLVAEGPQIHISEVGNYLHYTVRFQNTGTFAAENVRIVDMLAWNLDKSSLQVMSASHPYRAVLTGDKLEFWFDDINLPPQSEDEAGSNGYVAFRVKPASFVGLGHTMSNRAEIYFDFNFPIVTNTVSTTVTALSANDVQTKNFVIYPNPTTGLLNIETTSGLLVNQVQIFDLNGRLVVSTPTDVQISTIDISHLQKGIYLLEVQSDDGKQRFKIVKE